MSIAFPSQTISDRQKALAIGWSHNVSKISSDKLLPAKQDLPEELICSQDDEVDINDSGWDFREGCIRR
jgi:hypothetical protein